MKTEALSLLLVVEENQTLSTLSSILNLEWQLIRSDLLLLPAAA